MTKVGDNVIAVNGTYSNPVKHKITGETKNCWVIDNRESYLKKDGTREGTSRIYIRRIRLYDEAKHIEYMERKEVKETKSYINSRFDIYLDKLTLAELTKLKNKIYRKTRKA